MSDFIQDLSQLCAPLRQRLKKNPVPWNEEHIKIVKTVKSRVKTLPCLALANPEVFKIVETDALDIGYGGILKQRDDNQEKLVRYTLGTKIRFLGHHIYQGTIIPIQRSIEFADKFPDEIKDKKQLQRFLGSQRFNKIH